MEEPAVGKEEEEALLLFHLLGYPVKIPKRLTVPKWLRAIVEFRFPSSIDPFTGVYKAHRVIFDKRVRSSFVVIQNNNT